MLEKLKSENNIKTNPTSSFKNLESNHQPFKLIQRKPPSIVNGSVLSSKNASK